MVSTTARSRALVAGLAATATAWCGLASVSAPAQSAPPAEDCKAAYPVSALTKGQPVTGLTVSSGTATEEFTGEVLGVLDDGIAFDTDMIMMRLTSPEIDRVGGIWAGMSGSPVYAQDGRLIGAVAYGLAWGTTPVAGVTPFEDMDDLLEAPAARVKVGDRAARAIADATAVTVSQAREGFTTLPVPMTVSGVPDRALKKHGREYLSRASRGGGSSAAASGPADLVAGGNLGVLWAYGDVIGGGVGTVTSVCDGRLVGFGHPAGFYGKTAVQAMTPAEALYVQEDPLSVPYKVANFGAPAGSITGDHLTGVAGPIGPVPDSGLVSSTWTYGDRERTGATQVFMSDAMAAASFYEFIGNGTKVLDADWFEGTNDVSYTIKGLDPDGEPFTLRLANKYTSADLLYSGIFDVPDLLYYLGYKFPEATFTSVAHDAEVTDSMTTYRITGVAQKVGGTWVELEKGDRAKVKAGGTLRLRVELTDSDGGTERVKVSTDVPQRAAGVRGTLRVFGGGGYWGDFRGNDFRKALKQIRAIPSNDLVSVTLDLWTDGRPISKAVKSAEQSYVVLGSRRLGVRVR